MIQSVLPINASDIYLSDLGGNSIHRLTHSPLFDGMSQVVNSQEILFTSLLKNKFDLYKLKKKRTGWKNTLFKSSAQHLLQAQLHSPSQRLAWVEIAEDFLHSHIVIADAKGKSKETLDESIQFSFSPHWHPSGNYLLFTSNRDDYDNYELYVYDFVAKCIKRLTYYSTAELDPVFSPDGKEFYFSSNLNGTQQIYKMNFHPPESCPAPASTAKL